MESLFFLGSGWASATWDSSLESETTIQERQRPANRIKETRGSERITGQTGSQLSKTGLRLNWGLKSGEAIFHHVRMLGSFYLPVG
jgi:hypothetical protein